MEVDEIQRQVSKFQRVSSNGSTTTTENNNNNNNSNPHKIATRIGNFEGDGAGGAGGGMDVVVGGGGVARLCGWPASRIVRVSRASGGKDRHSKVLTSKGLRDRRVRLSVGTAIQFYDLLDRLGYEQPSKAVEWLLKAASSSIDELPSLDLPIVGSIPDQHHYHHQMSNQKKVLDDSNNFEERNNSNNNITQATQATTQANTQAKSPVYSSTSETSKGSDLSLSRAENRTKARERARELTSKKEKEKEKETDSTRVNVINHVNHISENSSFTDLLTGGINVNAATTAVRAPMEYYYNRVQQTPPQLFQLPQFNMSNGDNNNSNSNNSFHQFSFFHQQDNLNNFSMTSPSPSSGGVAPGGYTRGTLQSNLPASIMPHHHHLQRFQQSAIDGSAAANLPFFLVPNSGIDHFSATGGYHFSYGGGGDHHKDKAKN